MPFGKNLRMTSPPGGSALLLVFGNDTIAAFAAQLKGNLAPRGVAHGCAIFGAAAPRNGVELGADEHGHCRLRDRHDAGFVEDFLHALPSRCAWSAFGQVIQQCQCMGLAAAELGRQVEHGGGLGAFSRQAAHHLSRCAGQILSEVSALEEADRVLVIAGRAAIAHLIKVNGELGGVERLAIT